MDDIDEIDRVLLFVNNRTHRLLDRLKPIEYPSKLRRCKQPKQWYLFQKCNFFLCHSLQIKLDKALPVLTLDPQEVSGFTGNHSARSV